MTEEIAFEKTTLNTVKRYKHRAVYTKTEIFAIVRAAPVLHISFISEDGLPQCIPMVGAIETIDDETFVYLHGSSISRFVKANEAGSPMVVTATLVDGFILSLTPYSHDVQYRTAILHCTVFPIRSPYDTNPETSKLTALKQITNSVCPDRWENTRVPPTKTEITATGVLRLRVDEASAKVNGGGASDSDVDMKNEVERDRIWTGVLPIRMIALEPEASDYNRLEGKDVPDHIRNFREEFNKRVQVGAVLA